VVLIPARFTSAQEHEWVTRMLARLSAQDRRRRPGDADLAARAVELSRRYMGGLAQPASVAWAGNQNTRWGSCTPADRSIRLSTRLRGMPSWVIDYVLLHELAHLIEQGHGPAFWRLLETYPRTERARGFLEGFAAARRIDPGEDPDVDDDPGTDLAPDGALHGDSDDDPAGDLDDDDDSDGDSDDDSDGDPAGDVDRDSVGPDGAPAQVRAQSEPAS
jgi:hypothetical protein